MRGRRMRNRRGNERKENEEQEGNKEQGEKEGMSGIKEEEEEKENQKERIIKGEVCRRRRTITVKERSRRKRGQVP